MGFEVEPKNELEPWARDALHAQEPVPVEPEEFEYLVSPLALEYNRAEKIQDHVSYIRSHPELRDEVLIGAAEFDPQLAEEVRAALAIEAPAEQAQVAEPAEGAPAEQAAPGAQVEAFDYLMSPLALEYARDQKVADHVDFIRNNPALRDAVLSGAAEFDPQLAHDVQAALAQSPATEASSEVEQTPPEAVQHATEAAAPTETTPDTGPKPEPGWVTRARMYHYRHPEQAAQFNALTNNACVGLDWEIDPYLVAQWQDAHDLPPDGRIGNATVAHAVKTAPAELANQEAVIVDTSLEEEEEFPLDPKYAF